MYHLIALAAETKVAAKEFLNSLISPENSRNFPAFTCFPCLICCKTGACRDVAVSFHIRLGYGTETRMQYVFEIGLRHTHLFNMCGKDTMFWFGAPRCKESRKANWMYFVVKQFRKTNTHQQSTSLATCSDSSTLGPWKGSLCQTGLARSMGI